MHWLRSARALVGTGLLALVVFAACGSDTHKTSSQRAYGSSLAGTRAYRPNYGIGVPKTSTPTSNHGWLSIENRAGTATNCLIDSHFNTPFPLHAGGAVSVRPSKSASAVVDWIACGGDVSRTGFPGAVGISGLGRDPAGPNITLTFRGDRFTVSTA